MLNSPLINNLLQTYVVKYCSLTFFFLGILFERYLRAIASLVNSAQIRASPRNSAQVRAIREQLRAIFAQFSRNFRAIARNGIAIGNPSCKTKISL